MFLSAQVHIQSACGGIKMRQGFEAESAGFLLAAVLERIFLTAAVLLSVCP